MKVLSFSHAIPRLVLLALLIPSLHVSASYSQFDDKPTDINKGLDAIDEKMTDDPAVAAIQELIQYWSNTVQSKTIEGKL